jgi:hypothetical protein
VRNSSASVRQSSWFNREVEAYPIRSDVALAYNEVDTIREIIHERVGAPVAAVLRRVISLVLIELKPMLELPG